MDRWYNWGVAHPPEAPVFWIKYGPSIVWQEVRAQDLAHKQLRRLGSKVRAPAVFYACEMAMSLDSASFGARNSFIVMEYVPGKTARKVLEGAKDEAAEDAVYASIAFALSELHRIPVPPGTPPRGAGGGRIRNDTFDLREAPVDYQSVM